MENLTVSKVESKKKKIILAGTNGSELGFIEAKGTR